MTDYHESWSDTGVVDFFRTHRGSGREIYPSERWFLDRIVRPEMRVLDFGCAAGNFSVILNELYGLPFEHYSGVDISPAMIDEARRNHPACRFETSLEPFEAELRAGGPSFDIVYSFGTLHMTLEWLTIIRRLRGLNPAHLLFDVRLLVDQAGARGRTAERRSIEDMGRSFQQIGSSNGARHAGRVPYVILDSEDLEGRLRTVLQTGDTVETYGYEHAVSETVTAPHRRVRMHVCCISTGN